jgi:hypothetical protein
MIQINAAVRLPPKMAHAIDPRRASMIEAVGIATVVLSVAALVVLFSAL